LFYIQTQDQKNDSVMNSKNIATFNSDLPVHMTFAEQDWHLLAKHWYPIARASDLTD
jgi:hypothetical protein